MLYLRTQGFFINIKRIDMCKVLIATSGIKKYSGNATHALILSRFCPLWDACLIPNSFRPGSENYQGKKN